MTILAIGLILKVMGNALVWTFIFALVCVPRATKADVRYFVAGSILSEHIKSVSGHGSGAAGQAGGTYPSLGVGARVQAAFLGGSWYLLPSLSYTPFGRNLQDDAGRVNIWNLSLPFAAPVSFFDFKLGVGILFYQYRGYGGTVTLPNGTSTATFYKPPDSVTSKTVYADIGVGSDLGANFRFDLDVLISGLLSLKRDFGLVVQLGYFL